MQSLNAMKDWKLKSGSHVWPGPDGETCINEAALVAAGFPYRAIESVDDCPPCFSRVMANYLLVLNETLNDKDRQQLIRFVLRLAGTADTAAVEQQRSQTIARVTVERLLPVLKLRDGDAQKDGLRRRLSGRLASVLLKGSWHAATLGAECVNARLVAVSVCLEAAEAGFAIGKQSDALTYAVVSAHRSEVV